MTEMKPTVFVIVLNWNLKADLAECLSSLEGITYQNAQVVVVDNASADGSAEMVRARFPAAHLIVNKGNLGFAGGNNVGLGYALAQGAQYILLLNNDTLIAPDMLSRLVKVLEAEPSLGIVGPKILYYGHKDRIWYLGHRRSRWLPVPLRVKPPQDKCLGEPVWLEVDYLSGCGILIRHNVLEHIGLLDERMFMHYEDADFCQRAQQAGYRLACVPGARMWHKVSQSSRHEAPAVRHAKARNRVLFYRRYPHGPHPWITATFLLVSAGATLTVDLLQGRRELLRPHVQGLYEGLREPLHDAE